LKRRQLALGFVSLLGFSQLGACQALTGIKDRHYDADAGGTTTLASSQACEDFCDEVGTICTGALEVFHSKEVCVAVCKKLPAGDPKAPKGNTLACRAKQAENAKVAGEGYEAYCAAMGPGGGDVCGSNCGGYCDLYSKVCPKDALDDCQDKCKGLLDNGTLDAEKNHDGDTLECRLVHVSNAALDPAVHCGHARIAHPDAYCVDGPDDLPTCEHYCQVVNGECTGDQRVYESTKQCSSVCAALDRGTYGDQGLAAQQAADTVGCRLWHAYSAAVDPINHCAHAGPSGDGHCGDGSAAPNCAPYCRLLKAACSDQFESAFGGDDELCKSECTKLHGSAKDSGYAVASAEGTPASLACRLLYVSRAVDGTSSACDDAAGRGQHCR
jgi:hypothetical protein